MAADNIVRLSVQSLKYTSPSFTKRMQKYMAHEHNEGMSISNVCLGPKYYVVNFKRSFSVVFFKPFGNVMMKLSTVDVQNSLPREDVQVSNETTTDT
jgi:hypothetical protein